ncbi:MAG: hypothetical protein IID45_13990, partial [Planctomycetes bacterium]|nr:hypothetical protein [Planctomycetota bacterium]
MRSKFLGSIFLLTVIAGGAVAADRRVPIAQRGVDLVVVKGGPHLYGAIVSRDRNGTLTVAVRREWLKSQAPKYFAAALKAETARVATRESKAVERIDVWLKERADEPALIPFLQKEKKRLQALAAKRVRALDTSKFSFMLVRVSKAQIRSGFRQTRQRKQIALLAWREKLADPESRSVRDLFGELRKRGVDVSAGPVDLSDRLPPSPESQRSWAARQAIVEYDILKRVRFQGTSDYLVHAGGDKALPDVMSVFSEMLKNQLNNQLNNLLAEALGTPKAAGKKRREALQKAVRIAEKEKGRGFRVTRVDPNLLTNRVTVSEE